MNFGITISYVVGGFLLLSILAFNMNMNAQTQETTVSTINQQKLDNLVEVLSSDFGFLGFNDNDETSGYLDENGNTVFNPLLVGEDDEVMFNISYSDKIHWYADKSSPVTSTTNPNDYYLYREDDDGNVYQYAVTNFEITYYIKNPGTGNWQPVSDPSNTSLYSELTNVKIEVELLVESAEPSRSNYASGSETYHRTAWKREFVPSNVNLKQWD